jgi:hypothetical protein
MGASPRVLWSALVATACLAALIGGSPASAQQHEASLRSLGFAPDPIARSPRLLGMGRLTLADDIHNRISLWDFAGNPTGIAEAESVTTLEYRPLVRSGSSLRDVPAGAPLRERQDLGARQMRHALETWRRAPASPAYGLTAELATLQVDRPFGESVERRGSFTVPAIAGAVNARVPWLRSDRFDYALRLGYSLEVMDEGYFEFLRLPQGDYLGKPSAIVAPPDLFTPDRTETSSLNVGAGVSVRLTRAIKAAIHYDRTRVKVRAKLEGLRSTSKVDEDRPFHVGQASLIGRLGRHLEFGADGRAWRSQSEQFFFWSVSAGPTQGPLSGSGKRLDRDERGTSLRTRVRWVGGALELGASAGTVFRREIVRPWYPALAGDPAGFNDFLDEVGSRVGADTLMLPERLRATRVEERTLEFAAGGTWRMAGERGMLGVEFHRSRRIEDQVGVGAGPRPIAWDVRAGGEYRCTETLVTRLGWSYGVGDRDDLQSDDAFRGVVATGGFGYRPIGARWLLDVGYAHQWARADFVDPARIRGAEQHLAAQLRWAF